MYCSCIVLLFSASYKLLDHAKLDGLSDDITHARCLMTMLDGASSVDHVAKVYVDRVRPLWHEIQYLRNLLPQLPLPVNESKWFNRGCWTTTKAAMSLLSEISNLSPLSHMHSAT